MFGVEDNAVTIQELLVRSWLIRVLGFRHQYNGVVFLTSIKVIWKLPNILISFRAHLSVTGLAKRERKKKEKCWVLYRFLLARSFSCRFTSVVNIERKEEGAKAW